MPLMRSLVTVLFILSVALPAQAEEVVLHEPLQGTWRARVVAVESTEMRAVVGTDATSLYQTLRAELLEGDRKGAVVTVENDYLALEPGDTFFLNYLVSFEGYEVYTVSEPDRRLFLAGLIALFIVVAIVFGGVGAARAMVALALSFVLIIYGLLPSILAGYSPLVMALLFSVLIVGGGMLISHGPNRRTLAAFLGSASAVCAAVLLAEVAVRGARLSGFISDETAVLNIATEGTLNFAGIFLAAVIIGLLGLLDDIAITQATAVEELYETDRTQSRKLVFNKALRIGREHLAAVINTLALAYAGASLPLLLYFSMSDTSPLMIVNKEIFAAEIVRTIVGGIGLILTVPISTVFAVWLLIGQKKPET